MRLFVACVALALASPAAALTQVYVVDPVDGIADLHITSYDLGAIPVERGEYYKYKLEVFGGSLVDEPIFQPFSVHVYGRVRVGQIYDNDYSLFNDVVDFNVIRQPRGIDGSFRTQPDNSGGLIDTSYNHAFVSQSYAVYDAVISAYSSGPVTFVFNLTAVPEPATWGMMVAGFGAVGVVSRRRQIAERLICGPETALATGPTALA